ncbi:MAG: hypothetical protein IRZ28_20820 [Steroidobacteraceae bacterium]|nr:hypothetical protein [Steroidobacteraceae bacterium]
MIIHRAVGGPVSSAALFVTYSRPRFADMVAAVAPEGEECWRTGTPLADQPGWDDTVGWHGFRCCRVAGHTGRHRSRPVPNLTVRSGGWAYEWDQSPDGGEDEQ